MSMSALLGVVEAQWRYGRNIASISARRHTTQELYESKLLFGFKD